MILSAQRSGLIVAGLEDIQLHLSHVRRGLQLTVGLIDGDNGESETLVACTGGTQLLCSSVALERHRWQTYHDNRRRKW